MAKVCFGSKLTDVSSSKLNNLKFFEFLSSLLKDKLTLLNLIIIFFSFFCTRILLNAYDIILSSAWKLIINKLINTLKLFKKKSILKSYLIFPSFFLSFSSFFSTISPKSPKLLLLSYSCFTSSIYIWNSSKFGDLKSAKYIIIVDIKFVLILILPIFTNKFFCSYVMFKLLILNLDLTLFS